MRDVMLNFGHLIKRCLPKILSVEQDAEADREHSVTPAEMKMHTWPASAKKTKI